MIGGENADVFWYVTDHLGSVRAVTDEAGVVVWEGEYSPFGELLFETVHNPDFEDSHRFTGKMWEEESGLYYFNARYYDPAEGRFICEDPVRDGMNWYGYGDGVNNPLRFVDPTGLETVPTDYYDGTRRPNYFIWEVIYGIKS